MLDYYIVFNSLPQKMKKTKIYFSNLHISFFMGLTLEHWILAYIHIRIRIWGAVALVWALNGSSGSHSVCSCCLCLFEIFVNYFLWVLNYNVVSRENRHTVKCVLDPYSLKDKFFIKIYCGQLRVLFLFRHSSGTDKYLKLWLKVNIKHQDEGEIKEISLEH